MWRMGNPDIKFETDAATGEIIGFIHGTEAGRGKDEEEARERVFAALIEMTLTADAFDKKAPANDGH